MDGISVAQLNSWPGCFLRDISLINLIMVYVDSRNFFVYSMGTG